MFVSCLCHVCCLGVALGLCYLQNCMVYTVRVVEEPDDYKYMILSQGYRLFARACKIAPSEGTNRERSQRGRGQPFPLI